MRYFIIITLFIYALFATEPDAVLKIEKRVDQRATIKIYNSIDSTKSYIKKVNRLFIADFKVSGHFKSDNNISSIDYNIPVFALHLNNKYMLIYRFKKDFNGRATLDIKLYSGNPARLMLKKSYSVSRVEKYPFLIHKAVSDINNFAKYPPINWINRYVLLSRYIGPKKTEIILADYTFTYRKVIIKGGLNLFPIWADSKQRSLYYSHYGNSDNLTLYKVNIYTGQKSAIVNSSGMLACSDVSKDGSKLLLTMAPNSQPDIYLFSNGNLKRLTKFSGIDVGAKFVDNESAFVFVSNRLGSANIFKKSINGGAVTQVVHHGKNNSSCDAFDSQIVYSSKEGRGVFNIYLASSDGSQVRPLTSGGVNQFPRFSFDGNAIMYIKRDYGGNSIGFINLGANRSELFKLGISRIQSIDW